MCVRCEFLVTMRMGALKFYQQVEEAQLTASVYDDRFDAHLDGSL